MTNTQRLTKMFPGTKWQKRGNDYVGALGNQEISFHHSHIKNLFKETKRKNSIQIALNRAVDDMKAKAWNSKEAN